MLYGDRAWRTVGIVDTAMKAVEVRKFAALVDDTASTMALFLLFFKKN
jgi:hypothetical protein